MCRTGSEPEFAIGVTGKEFAALVDEEKKTLLREKDLEVVGLSREPSDGGVSGIMRTVLSASWGKFFTLRLL